MITEKPYSDYFAYPQFRPEQDKMLDAAWVTLQKDNPNKVLMISAPTGSGKSSVISPTLKYAREHGMKTIVAVNTKSQIGIFVEELERIRRECRHDLTYAYLMGKSDMCTCRKPREDAQKQSDKPKNLVDKFLEDAAKADAAEESDENENSQNNKIGGMDVYEECRLRKRNSRTSMNIYAANMSTEDTAEDFGYAVDETGYSNSNLSGCPYYEMVYSQDSGDYEQSVIKPNAQAVIDKLMHAKVMPDELLSEIPIDMCPYEICLQAARNSDVVIVNYNHIVVDNVRGQLLSALGVSTEEIVLIVDEAHNLGDRVRNTHMVELTEDNLRRALENISGTYKSNLIINTIATMRGFMKERFKDEDFKSKSKSEQLPFGIMELVRKFGQDGLSDSDRIAELKVCIGELDKAVNSDREAAQSYTHASKDTTTEKSDISKVADFLRVVVDAYFARAQSGETHIGIVTALTRKRKGAESRPRSLGVMNVDPSPYITKLTNMFYRTIMISGTLEPIDGYATIFFGKNASVDSVILKNHFPKKNRAIFCVEDVDSSAKYREQSNMLTKYQTVISNFCQYVHGNVAVFGPSYAMRDVYGSKSNYHGKKIIVEPNGSYYPTTQKIDGHDCVFSWDGREREMFTVDEHVPSKATSMLIKEFKKFPELGIEGVLVGVCGGKMSEGIDYKGDALKGVLILGFPYGAYNAVQKEIIRIYSNKYGNRGTFLAYTLPSLNKAVQAIGRLLRTETDTGVIVLADNRFSKNAAIKKGLPLWISSEMQATTSGNLKVRLSNLSM